MFLAERLGARRGQPGEGRLWPWAGPAWLRSIMFSIIDTIDVSLYILLLYYHYH